MGTTFTLPDALALRHVHDHAWNDDGTAIGYLRFDGGDTDVVVRAAGDVDGTDLGFPDDRPDARTECGTVSELAWRPGASDELAFVADGAIERLDVERGERTLLAQAPADHASLAWHPDGDRLAAIRDGEAWLFDLGAGSSRALGAGDGADADRGDGDGDRGDGLTVASLFAGTPLEWSPDGRRLATIVEAPADGLGLAVYDVDAGEVAWSRRPGPTEGRVIDAFDWVGPDELVYAEETVDGTRRRYRAASVDDPGPGPTILAERDERGLARDPIVGTDGGRFATLSARTGSHHVYAVDVGTRRSVVAADETEAGRDAEPEPGFGGPGVAQVTEGDFEARGDALDEPAWDPDGRRLAHVTNERDPGERDLVVATVDPDAGTVEDRTVLDDEPGNALYPEWGPDGDRLAVIRSGRTTPADVHLVDAADGDLRRVSRTHPEPEVFESFPEPEPVSISREPGDRPSTEADDGAGPDAAEAGTVPGYLYVPPDAEPGDDRPAVVWCHGGPVRQMRRGFHHMRSYAFFHAFNHLLVSKGYVVLALNYRGGIGYGRDVEHGIHEAIGAADVADCVAAARFCREHEAVGDRVGLWGLSYGGFLACAVATRTDAYDCAVNFAGVWDWADWVQYATDRHWGAGRGFVARFGGHPDEADEDEAIGETYRVASPASFVDDLDTPLYSLHGTADPNVPFDQLDALVGECVAAERDFEVMYYPAENHMFESRDTWRDALDRVRPFLDEHLRS
ncbi:prolyl oligopeptidase family serine peptidase [Halovivax sp.]|uniref:S9 family peptidase n=1 Tax=Halovivax sp. TaxID=1935978 RepID=UPI0025BB9AA5|nr:prolyl oligopeptidase family serine peptidase [Halovivax sp.]